MNMRIDMRPLAYRVDDAAKIVGVSKSKMWEFIKRGDLRTFKLDGSTLIRHEAIEDLLVRAEQGALGQPSGQQ